MGNKAKMQERQDRLSLDRLKRVLSYNPDTGVFVWLERISIRIVVGKVAGVPDRHGHRIIKIDGTKFMAHRLAWFYHHGEWPVDQIDHRDTNRDNNAILNLRLSSQMENLRNRVKSSLNTSGFKGVTLHSWSAKGKPKWLAQIGANNKHYYLGLFDSPEDAHAAYVAASNRLHGEFARAA